MESYPRSLQYTAVTSSGRVFEFDFPLHQHTRSDKSVSDLLTSLLECTSTFTNGDHAMSDGDILQALVMGLAVRARMVDETGDTSRQLLHELVDIAIDATSEARVYQAARA